MALLDLHRPKFSRVRTSGVNGASAGPLVDGARARRQRPIGLEITTRAEAVKSVIGIPQRWMVERTRGWCNRSRRLSKDSEDLPQSRAALSG
jgi:hypothetical protein